MSNVKLYFAFYDTTEENKFKSNYPVEYDIIKDHINTQVEIPIEDFETFFLFRHQMLGTPDLSTFDDFFTKVAKYWGPLEIYYKYDPQKEEYYSLFDSNNGNNDISDALGVAGALAISSKIFLGTTQADWRKLPIVKTKDFDFEHLAAHDNKYLVVEAKGSIVDNNRSPSKVSYHKTSILDKKNDPKFQTKYVKPLDVCYGIITVADKTNGLKSWLVDPPTLSQEIDPRKYKLLARLYFYFDYVRLISTRSHLSIALANRIKVLEKSLNIDDFDKLPLVNSNFKKVEISDAFFNSKSNLSDRKIIGSVYVSKEEEIIFIGLSLTILNLLIDQDFKALNTYSNSKPSTIEETLNCVINKDQRNIEVFTKLKQLLEIKKEEDNLNFKCKIKLATNSAGVTFGKTTFQSIII